MLKNQQPNIKSTDLTPKRFLSLTINTTLTVDKKSVVLLHTFPKPGK